MLAAQLKRIKMKRKPEADSSHLVGNSFSDVNITNSAPEANEHTRSAVEALSKAAEANANAIAAIANALKGGNATIERAINISGG